MYAGKIFTRTRLVLTTPRLSTARVIGSAQWLVFRASPGPRGPQVLLVQKDLRVPRALKGRLVLRALQVLQVLQVKMVPQVPQVRQVRRGESVLRGVV
jgi:hypothetical protein